jgi:hypothetical protein
LLALKKLDFFDGSELFEKIQAVQNDRALDFPSVNKVINTRATLDRTHWAEAVTFK